MVLIYRFIYHIALYTYRSDLNRKERTIKKEKTEQLLQGKERVYIPSLLPVLSQRAQTRSWHQMVKYTGKRERCAVRLPRGSDG